MSYTTHHAIVVTTFDLERAQTARAEARDIFPLEIVTMSYMSRLNGWWTFIILPDGSKDGWDTSNQGDAARTQFIEWLETQRYADGSSPYTYVEIAYASDDPAVVQRESYRLPLRARQD